MAPHSTVGALASQNLFQTLANMFNIQIEHVSDSNLWVRILFRQLTSGFLLGEWTTREPYPAVCVPIPSGPASK